MIQSIIILFSILIVLIILCIIFCCSAYHSYHKIQQELHKMRKPRSPSPDDVIRAHREMMLRGHIIDAVNYARIKAQESNDKEFYDKFNKLFYEIQK